MPLKLHPLSDHLIVRPHKETTSASGIVIPDTVKSEKTDRGEVLSVGPGKELENGNISTMSVTVGQHVIFSKYAADEIEANGETLLVISQADVKAVVTETEA